MGRVKKTGPTARFGGRYGTAPRKRRAEAEVKMKQAYPCPKCGANIVRRVSVGVWGCRKCGYIFTGGAYVPFTKVGEIAKRAARGLPQAEVPVTAEPEKGETEQSS